MWPNRAPLLRTLTLILGLGLSSSPGCGPDDRSGSGSGSPEAGKADRSGSDGPTAAEACRFNSDCTGGEICQLDEGACLLPATPEGTCARAPDQCAAVLDPVCGCDGGIYDNACFAARAGVSVASRGACTEPKPCSYLNEIQCTLRPDCEWASDCSAFPTIIHSCVEK